MSKVSIPFQPSTIDAWKAQLNKELNENTGLLQYQSEIEGIQLCLTELEGPQLRTDKNEAIIWKRMVQISARNAKEANSIMLQSLMQGADAIYIDNVDSNTNWSDLLDNIETRFIDCLICFNSIEALAHFKGSADQQHLEFCKPLYNFSAQRNVFSTFNLQQIGANCATELALCLYELHQHLEHNKVSQTVYFDLGIGSDFLIEIAKIKALKAMINKLQDIHETVFDIQIISKTGFCNKSLKDPYTNLLRQATEALSAVLGGVHFICIQPYDLCSLDGSSAFSRRMALNIGNLINEEAQLSLIQNPLNGSFAVEQLTLALCQKSWQFLCDLDANQQESIAKLRNQIDETRKIRKERFNSGKDMLIGINAHKNPFDQPNSEWAQLPEALGFPFLIFEKLAN